MLEAVRGWQALDPDATQEEETKEGEEANAAPVVDEKDEDEWTEDNINELKNKDIVNLMLAHEQHVSGKLDDEVHSLRKFVVFAEF